MITRSNYDLQFEVAYAARVCALHETVWRRVGLVLTLILVLGATAAVKGYVDRDADFAAVPDHSIRRRFEKNLRPFR